MKVKFWGVRGSINSPLSPAQYSEKIRAVLAEALDKGLRDKEKIGDFISSLPAHLQTTYGGNTSCITVSDDDTLLIFDAGTGIRNLGNEILKGSFFNNTSAPCDIFFTHLHLDHINGLPFFAPVHIPGRKINFYSHHPEFEAMLKLQQNPNFFPVSLESRPSEKSFSLISEGQVIDIGGFSVRSKKLNHPNSSYSYSIEKSGKKIVYATDAEYTAKSVVSEYFEFFNNADILIFDSQYNFNELAQRYSFGHSTAEIGVDAAVSSNVKKLLLFHHNHESSDERISQMLNSSLKYLQEKYPGSELEIIISNEGMEFNL